jgi:hypothetical protein
MNSPPSDDDRFDRLVDGELSELERRELLATLDQEPDGWRRCALAFLEAQCWKEGLGRMIRPSKPIPVAHPRAPASGARSFRIYGGTLLAMAASFLLVFSLVGYWLGGGTPGPAPSGIASNTAGISLPPVGVAPAATPSSPWRLVSLNDPASGADALTIPAREYNHWDDQWMKNMPPAVPENVLQALERTGHRVQRQRELLPLRMDDGRVLIVPVEQMEIQPVSRPAY